MEFKKYSCVKEFYNDTYEILMRHEAQNMILLGNLIIGVEGKTKQTGGIRLTGLWQQFPKREKSYSPR